MIDQAKSFILVAQTGSVSRAAETLRLTQPAVTHHLRQLESFFGKKIIYRSKGRMALTPDGLLILEKCQKLALSFSEFESSSKLNNTSEIRFGSLDSAVDSFLPTAIYAFQKKHASTALYPTDQRTILSIQQLKEHRLDFAIGTFSATERELHFEPLIREPLVLVRSKEMKKKKNFNSYLSEPMILFPRETLTRSMIDIIFSDLNITPTVVCESVKVSTITSLVSSGIGNSIIPFFSALRLAKGSAITIIDIPTHPTRVIGIYTRKGYQPSDTTQHFIDEIRKQIKTFEQPKMRST